MQRLAGKVALVTGAARGMGAEHARVLVAEGARVIIADVLEAEGSALANELGAAAMFLPLDVGDEAAWARAMAEAERFGGGLDCLVNNAGIVRLTSIADTELATFALHQRINELGVFLGMKHAAPLIAARGGGSIVNIASLGAFLVAGNDIAYVASKWAVRGMTKSAAKEYGPLQIRVNTVHPGMVKTAMNAEVPPDVLAARLARIPLGRIGMPADISAMVLFLLSDESRYMTGADIVVDGGLGI